MTNKTSFSVVGMLVLGVALISVTSLGASQLYAAENSKKMDVLVSFDTMPGKAEEKIVHAFGGTVSYIYSITPAIAASVPEAAINGLSHNPHVTAVEIDGPVYATDAVSELNNSWGVQKIEAGTVHTSGNTGAGVKIGIIDSGINYNHQDLNDVYRGGYDFVENQNDLGTREGNGAMDVYGHGTHVAGTACAEANSFGVVGVAPNCALYSLRVLNNDGVGSWSKTIAAMEWAVAHDLQVVNLSLGNAKNPGTAVKTAFDNAANAGIVIVAAAGNSGNKAGKGDNIIYPAKYASVIAVGATDSANKRASFSSTGNDLEIMAPGVSVLSTWNDDTSYLNPQPFCLSGYCYYKYGSGTSMASPHVAGVAALVIASGLVSDTDGLNGIYNEVRAKLNSTATNLGVAGKDTQYGWGLVNAVAATQ